MWQQALKELNVSIHIIATGAGAGLQKELWATCGSSAYLSGASFPYAIEEQEELLGFMPTKFCCKETAIDLASAAYMKAFRFGGKSPIGIGITASVATEKAHRGEHGFYTCVMTDTQIVADYFPLTKGEGTQKRYDDGAQCDFDSLFMLLSSLNLTGDRNKEYPDVTNIALKRFFDKPFFAADGKRYSTITNTKQYGLLSGSFNPPHEGHFGIADAFSEDNNSFHEGRQKVLFETAFNPPHKNVLTVQDLLKRAKMLCGKDRIFTNIPFFIDKVKAFPGMPLIVGTDTLDRMLDPKWKIDMEEFLKTINNIGNDIFVVNRIVDNKLLSINDVFAKYKDILPDDVYRCLKEMVHHLPGQWDISSSELRGKGL